MYRWRWWKPSTTTTPPNDTNPSLQEAPQRMPAIGTDFYTSGTRGGKGTMREHRFRYGNGGSPSQRISLERNASLFFPAVLRPTQAQMPSVSSLNSRLQSRTLPGLKGPKPCKPALAPASPSPHGHRRNQSAPGESPCDPWKPLPQSTHHRQNPRSTRTSSFRHPGNPRIQSCTRATPAAAPGGGAPPGPRQPAAPPPPPPPAGVPPTASPAPWAGRPSVGRRPCGEGGRVRSRAPAA